MYHVSELPLLVCYRRCRQVFAAATAAGHHESCRTRYTKVPQGTLWCRFSAKSMGTHPCRSPVYSSFTSTAVFPLILSVLLMLRPIPFQGPSPDGVWPSGPTTYCHDSISGPLWVLTRCLESSRWTLRTHTGLLAAVSDRPLLAPREGCWAHTWLWTGFG